MKPFAFLIAFFCAALITAQEAKIIIVEKEDTTELKLAYGEYKAALQHWEKIKTKVAKRYTIENGKILEGWDKIEFSVDFRALVPKRDYYSSGLILSPGWSNGNIIPNVAANTYATTASADDRTISLDGVRSDIKTVEKK